MRRRSVAHPYYDKYKQMLHAARMQPEHWGGVSQAAASDVPAPKRRPHKLQPLQPSRPPPVRLLSRAVASAKLENLQKLQPPPLGARRQ